MIIFFVSAVAYVSKGLNQQMNLSRKHPNEDNYHAFLCNKRIVIYPTNFVKHKKHSYLYDQVDTVIHEIVEVRKNFKFCINVKKSVVIFFFTNHLVVE